jgi:hypothetical protein
MSENNEKHVITEEEYSELLKNKYCVLIGERIESLNNRFGIVHRVFFKEQPSEIDLANIKKEALEDKNLKIHWSVEDVNPDNVECILLNPDDSLCLLYGVLNSEKFLKD